MRLVDLRDSHIQELVREMLKINRPQSDGQRTSETLRRLIEVRADDDRRVLPPGEKRQKKVKQRVWTAEREASWRASFQQRLAEAKEMRKETGKRTPTALDVWRSTPRPSPVMVWLPVHTGRFLDFIESERLYALFHLVAFTGLRRPSGVQIPEPPLSEQGFL